MTGGVLSSGPSHVAMELIVEPPYLVRWEMTKERNLVGVRPDDLRGSRPQAQASNGCSFTSRGYRSDRHRTPAGACRAFPLCNRPAPATAGAPQFVYDGRLGELYWIFHHQHPAHDRHLGIWRFWGKTRMRRYLWSHTSLSGDRFEYTGTGGELFVGFIIVMIAYVLGSIGLTALQIVFEPGSIIRLLRNRPWRLSSSTSPSSHNMRHSVIA